MLQQKGEQDACTLLAIFGMPVPAPVPVYVHVQASGQETLLRKHLRSGSWESLNPRISVLRPLSTHKTASWRLDQVRSGHSTCVTSNCLLLLVVHDAGLHRRLVVYSRPSLPLRPYMYTSYSRETVTRSMTGLHTLSLSLSLLPLHSARDSYLCLAKAIDHVRSVPGRDASVYSVRVRHSKHGGLLPVSASSVRPKLLVQRMWARLTTPIHPPH